MLSSGNASWKMWVHRGIKNQTFFVSNEGMENQNFMALVSVTV